MRNFGNLRAAARHSERSAATVGGDHHRDAWSLSSYRKLVDGDEGHRRRLSAQIVVFGVGDGADDFVSALWILRLGPDVNELADGLRAAEKSVDEGLVHDDHERRIGSVCRSEIAA